MAQGFSSKYPLVVGIGNPNLDCIIKVPDACLLTKYNLVMDGQEPRPYETLASIIKDATERNYEISYVAGGLEQNTLRMFQWLMEEPFRTVIFGAVGDDVEAILLKKQVECCGVSTRYVNIPGHRTSFVVLISYKSYRSAVANIDAGQQYRLHHLTSEDFEFISKSEIVLMSGFCALHAAEVYFKILADENRTAVSVFNIGGTYVFNSKSTTIVELAKLCDIVIGNKKEVCALFTHSGIKNISFLTSLKTFHTLMLDNTTKNLKDWKKIIVVTDGPGPIHCICGTGDVITFEVPVIDEKDIVDTTGAGDAFLAGFLYGLFRGENIQKSLEIGSKVSKAIMCEYGVTIPKYSSKDLFL